MIRAVVFDLGSVLEVIDDSVFPAPFERRHGLTEGALLAVAASLPGNPGIGELTEEQMRQHWQRELGLDDAQVQELVADYWRWYVGTVDEQLLDWFAAQRPRRRTAILSNSGPGAREHEPWVEEVADVVVYSHEVGLAKPDPAVFELTTRLLDVDPAEVVFLDDVPGHVEAARRAGWHAVVHVDTPTSVAALERLIADADGRC